MAGKETGAGSADATGEETSQDETTQSAAEETTQDAAEETSVSTDIDWSTVKVTDIPKDVLEQHPAYKTVLSESINRRKEINALKKEVSTTEETTADADTEDASPLTAKMDKLETMMERFIDTQIDKDTNEVRRSLATAHNVPEDRMKYITGETMEELTDSAKELGDAPGGVSGTTSAGNASGGSDGKGALRTRIRGGAEDKGAEAPSIFDVGTQRVRGGGAVKR